MKILSLSLAVALSVGALSCYAVVSGELQEFKEKIINEITSTFHCSWCKKQITDQEADKIVQCNDGHVACSECLNNPPDYPEEELGGFYNRVFVSFCHDRAFMAYNKSNGISTTYSDLDGFLLQDNWRDAFRKISERCIGSWVVRPPPGSESLEELLEKNSELFLSKIFRKKITIKGCEQAKKKQHFLAEIECRKKKINAFLYAGKQAGAHAGKKAGELELKVLGILQMMMDNTDSNKVLRELEYARSVVVVKQERECVNNEMVDALNTFQLLIGYLYNGFDFMTNYLTSVKPRVIAKRQRNLRISLLTTVNPLAESGFDLFKEDLFAGFQNDFLQTFHRNDQELVRIDSNLKHIAVLYPLEKKIQKRSLDIIKAIVENEFILKKHPARYLELLNFCLLWGVFPRFALDNNYELDAFNLNDFLCNIPLNTICYSESGEGAEVEEAQKLKDKIISLKSTIKDLYKNDLYTNEEELLGSVEYDQWLWVKPFMQFRCHCVINPRMPGKQASKKELEERIKLLKDIAEALTRDKDLLKKNGSQITSQGSGSRYVKQANCRYAEDSDGSGKVWPRQIPLALAQAMAFTDDDENFKQQVLELAEYLPERYTSWLQQFLDADQASTDFSLEEDNDPGLCYLKAQLLQQRWPLFFAGESVEEKMQHIENCYQIACNADKACYLEYALYLDECQQSRNGASACAADPERIRAFLEQARLYITAEDRPLWQVLYDRYCLTPDFLEQAGSHITAEDRPLWQALYDRYKPSRWGEMCILQ